MTLSMRRWVKYAGCAHVTKRLAARCFATTATQTPLRVLFCGSDDFSAVSLQRLVTEAKRDKSLIASIDVVCRASKPTGRGLKAYLDSPVKQLAISCQLPLHEIPTFTGWSPPTQDIPGSLIVAVSFGLKVPPRLLNGAQYGGINVHPSLLPDLRGPAPLQHAILRGDRATGVTVQTLHPQRFDHGLVLAQASFPVPNEGHSTYATLSAEAAKHGAELLISTLRSGSLTKFAELEYASSQGVTTKDASSAPRLDSEDARIDWRHWDLRRILRTQRAIGPLWSEHCLRNGKMARVQWHDLEPVCFADSALLQGEPLTMNLLIGTSKQRSIRTLAGKARGTVELLDPADVDHDLLLETQALNSGPLPRRAVVITCTGGGYAVPRSITVEGRRKKADPAEVLPQLLELDKHSAESNESMA